MPYLFNTPEDQQTMLDAIGVGSIDALFQVIPESVRLKQPLNLPSAMSELELTRHVDQLAARNRHASDSVCFLGGGSYDHFIPAVVDHLASRGEFYTSYTPYQPEVSQGNLQAMFEYQTMICQLTGLDVSNASLYDGGSATIEAVLMSMSATRRDARIVVAGSVHPEYRQILETYLGHLGCEIVTVPTPEGRIAGEALARAVDDRTACVVIQHPNFFGVLEDVAAASEIARQAGALSVQVFDPISVGLLKRPAELGADIAVAEGQCLGNPLLFGGPYLGIMACREEHVRRLPGRIAGQTTDRRGRRCWVLTLQTREQHIRREKATSNICTNQGLFALRAAIYLSLLGKEGLRETAALCLQKTRYAADQFRDSDAFQLAWSHPTFKEFVVRSPRGQVSALMEESARRGILAGVPLGRWYPELEDCFLVAVTEKRTRNEIDRLVRTLSEAAASTTIHA